MIKIGPKITAAVNATKDRIYINRYSKGKIDEPELLYNSLVKKSGPPAKTIKTMFQSWLKAYQANIQRSKLIEDINNCFKANKKLTE